MSNTSLSFEPDADLIFNGKTTIQIFEIHVVFFFSEDDTATLYVRNTIDQKMVCKVEAKEGDCYQINPVYFFLLSSIENVVKSKNKHCIQIRNWCTAHTNSFTHPKLILNCSESDHLLVRNIRSFFVSVNCNGDADDEDRNSHEFSVSWLAVLEKDVADNAETYVSDIFSDQYTYC